MCKLLIMPNVKSKELAQKFMKAARPDFTADDNDGVGYAALTDKGLYGERWLNVKDAFRKRVNTPIKGHEAFAQLGKVLKSYSPEGTYNNFGEDGSKWHSVIYHSRMATCGVSLKNVHPFIKGDTALIHNGIINDAPTDWKAVQSTCDSEQALNGYVDLAMTEDPETVTFLADELSGWYAFGVLSKQASGRWILDIIKDSRTGLSATYVKELETIVFCTDPSIVDKACKLLKWTVGDTFEVEGDRVIRFDAVTGEVLNLVEFESFEPISKYSSYSKAESFGEKDRGLIGGRKEFKEWEGYDYDAEARTYSETEGFDDSRIEKLNDDLDLEMRERMAYESFDELNPSPKLVNLVQSRLSGGRFSR